PAGRVGVFYRASVGLSGGTQPYLIYVNAGGLPRGLALNTSAATLPRRRARWRSRSSRSTPPTEATLRRAGAFRSRLLDSLGLAHREYHFSTLKCPYMTSPDPPTGRTLLSPR